MRPIITIVGRSDQGDVFGRMKRLSSRCSMKPVSRRDAATLLPLIEQHILLGTRILSDIWGVYNGIEGIRN